MRAGSSSDKFLPRDRWRQRESAEVKRREMERGKKQTHDIIL